VEFGSLSRSDAVVDNKTDVIERIGYNLLSVRIYRTDLLLDISNRRHGPKVVLVNCARFGRKK